MKKEEEEEESSEEEEKEEEEAEEAAPASKKQKGSNGQAVDVSAANGSRTIFVKNLSWSADEPAIRDFFSAAGPIAEVRIATDRDTGRMRGFAHVVFETLEGAAAATQQSGQDMLGREIYIESTPEREQREFCALCLLSGGGGE